MGERLRPRRALLFVPGDRADMIPKTLRHCADAVIIDLEDAVLPDQKDRARSATTEAIEELDFGPRELVVRINGFRTGETAADLAALEPLQDRIDAVILPKCASADELRQIAARLPRVWLIPLLESARGILDAGNIARVSPKVVALMFGGGDLCADIGAEPGRESLLHARSHIVLAAAANGLQAIDTPFMHTKDVAGLEDESRHAASLGFAGKAVIHPGQIDLVNRIFTPSQERVAWANGILSAYRKAGRGVVAVDGEVVDLMTVRMAEEVLARAGDVE